MAHDFEKELQISSTTESGRNASLHLKDSKVLFSEQLNNSILEKEYSLFEFYLLIKKDSGKDLEFRNAFGSSNWVNFKDTIVKHTFRTKTGRLPGLLVDIINHKAGFAVMVCLIILFIAGAFFATTIGIGSLKHSVVDLRYLALYLLIFPLLMLVLSYLVIRPKFGWFSKKRIIFSLVCGSISFFYLITVLFYMPDSTKEVTAQVHSYKIETEDAYESNGSAEDKLLILSTETQEGDHVDISIFTNKIRSEQESELIAFARQNKTLKILLNVHLPGIKIYKGYKVP